MPGNLQRSKLLLNKFLAYTWIISMKYFQSIFWHMQGTSVCRTLLAGLFLC
jgi:hypothetical protein